jgi:hypothetical protein
MVRVPGCRSRGHGFNSWRYQIFGVAWVWNGVHSASFIIIIIIIIIINFKLQVGFHPVAVALQNDTQIKHEDK